MISLNVFSVSYAANFQIPDKVQIGEWYIGRDGYLLLSDFESAKQYCAERGQHLPSVPEMVRVAIDFGANGIVPNPIPRVSTYVTAENVDGTTAFFHWDWRGFTIPASWHRVMRSEFDYKLLTSSVDHTFSEDSRQPMLFYLFHTLNGDFVRSYISHGGTGYFFCVPGL